MLDQDRGGVFPWVREVVVEVMAGLAIGVGNVMSF